ncbi:MAG: S-layer homology domain-containing protein [bacterium]
MRNWKTKFTVAAAIVLFVAVLTLLFGNYAYAKESADPFALEIVDDASFLNQIDAISPVKPISPNDTDAYADVPPDHWAYKAVKYLSDIGLLGGYDENLFKGDKPVTRYELSLIIAKLVANYNQYIRTGSFGSGTLAPAIAPAAAQNEPATLNSDSAAPAATPAKLEKISAPISVIGQKTGLPGEMQLEGISAGRAPMSHSKPKLLGAPAAGASTTPADKKADAKPAKEADKTPAKDKKATPLKPPKELTGLEKRVELTDKDIEILKTLVDYINKNVTAKITDLDKKLRNIDRLGQQNKRDIDQLEQDNERFKVNGSGYVEYNSTDYKDSSTGVGLGYGTSWWWNSKPRKYEDMTLTSGGALRYQNFKASNGPPKNFKLRSISGGPTSFGALLTALTTSGVDYSGFRTELSLNKYTIISSLGRISSNNYINASSLQFNLFNEPRSLCYVTHIQTWEDADKVTAAEKNSVSSLSIRYPLPAKGLYFTSEYAHSTYHRPQRNYSWRDSTYEPKDIFQSWLPIPELTFQDEAFFVLLDYNKGPLTIFPLGYIRIGPKFYSRYLGLPGMSMSNFGISMLPISLQSLQLWAMMGNYKKPEKKLETAFIVAIGGETEPMFFDTSKVDTTIGQLNLIARLNNRPKDAKIKLQYWENKISYYPTDRNSFSWKYSTASGGLGPTCIDGNYTYVSNDQNQVIDAFIGNGVANCDPNSATYDTDDLSILLRFLQRSQEFNMFWRTSNRGEFTMNYNFSELRLNVVSNVGAVNDAVANMVDQGRVYNLNYNFKYRLTDVSRIETWYNNYFGRPDINLTRENTLLRSTVGVRLSMDF